MRGLKNAAIIQHERKIYRELLGRSVSIETTPFSNKIVHFYGYAYIDFRR
jgi:hypothetical protein